MHGKKFFAGGVFILRGVLSVDAWFSLPLQPETFTQSSLYTQKLLHKKAFTQRSFYTQKLLHKKTFTQESFCTQKLPHTEALYTEKSYIHRGAYTHRGVYTEKPLHRGAFAHRILYTQTRSHTGGFTNRQLYGARNFTQSSFYAAKLVHTHTHRGAFLHRSFCIRFFNCRYEFPLGFQGVNPPKEG